MHELDGIHIANVLDRLLDKLRATPKLKHLEIWTKKATCSGELSRIEQDHEESALAASLHSIPSFSGNTLITVEVNVKQQRAHEIVENMEFVMRMGDSRPNYAIPAREYITHASDYQSGSGRTRMRSVIMDAGSVYRETSGERLTDRSSVRELFDRQ